MIQFLKDRYYELYDLPHFYLGINDEWKCHLFSILYIIILLILIILIIKIFFEIRKSRKERMKSFRHIEKTLLKPYDNNKNKDNIK